MSGMTDIVFLLLIFFMLTSTLIAPNAIKLLLPKSSNQTQATPNVTVSITKNIDYYVGTKKVSFSQIEPMLQKELKYRVEPTISLHADKSVDVEYVVKVMNIAKRNKYKVILATAPE
ncbi:MAG: biopolymer transporter ExbD [Bacteroidales bacterium]|nr:biopolymer transporter ExbD [Bacteroidales bacterium]MBN2821514.1 biopolymer transporter ExbD [Bacteroidales bacterium]